MANDQAYKLLNTIAASTGPKYVQGRLEDIFFDAHPFFESIKANGNIKKSGGTGKSLVQNIRIGSNSTVGNRSTRDVVPLVQQETNTTAEWPWGSITGSISFDDQDLHDNMGTQQLVNLLETAIDQLVDSWVDRLSVNILTETSAASDFQFLGVKDAVTDGTWMHPATYGGLATTDATTWAATVTNNGGTLADLVDDLNTTYNSCSFGSKQKQPDFVLTDQKGEELYRGLMDSNIRYTDTGKGDATINSVTFRGVPVLFDRDVTGIPADPNGLAGATGAMAWTGTLDTASTHRYYLLNSRVWEFHFDSQWNLDNAIENGWRIPTNQFRRSKLMALRGQLIVKQRRYQGLLTNVPES